MNIEELTEKLSNANEEANAEIYSQYLTFLMNDEEYGVDILAVQEIRGWSDVTEIPNSPDYVKGVINLRGTILPVIDLRVRFGLPSESYTDVTVVIVVKVEFPERDKIMGIVVDAVSDVHTVTDSESVIPPDVGETANGQYVQSLVSKSDKMIVLLDLNKLLDIEKNT